MGRLRWSQLGWVGLLFSLFACACQAPISASDGETTDRHADPTQPNFVLLLYPDGSFDPKVDKDGLQPGLRDAESATPIDTLTEIELVGAKWSERTLIFGPTVRQRYDDSGYPSLPVCQFVLRFKGQVLFGGDVVNTFSARAIRFPVAVYEVHLDPSINDNGTLVIRLMSNSGDRNPMSEIPGLTPESNGEIDRYLTEAVGSEHP